jgi:sortase A
MKAKRIWTIVMLIGILLICTAGGLVLNNALTAKKAEERSKAALTELSQIISPAAEEQEDDETQQVEARAYERPLSEVAIDGLDYIGMLYIPTLELGLPVLSDFSYDNLTIAPVRYYGEIYSHDLVVCAHNYEGHFGRLKELQAGDALQFVDTTGAKYNYEVSTVETIRPTAIEEVTSGKNDLTLLTCTTGGNARVLVRCDSVD